MVKAIYLAGIINIIIIIITIIIIINIIIIIIIKGIVCKKAMNQLLVKTGKTGMKKSSKWIQKNVKEKRINKAFIF